MHPRRDGFERKGRPPPQPCCQVVVIGHQAIGMHLPVDFLASLRQPLEEVQPASSLCAPGCSSPSCRDRSCAALEAGLRGGLGRENGIVHAERMNFVAQARKLSDDLHVITGDVRRDRTGRAARRQDSRYSVMRRSHPLAPFRSATRTTRLP